MGAFETSPDHPSQYHRPIQVPTRKEDVFGAAREMVEDLSDWTVVNCDEDKLELTCSRGGGFLGGKATIVIAVTGPDGIPSATVNVRSTTEGGMRSRDKQNVAEFIKPFHRRIC